MADRPVDPSAPTWTPLPGHATHGGPQPGGPAGHAASSEIPTWLPGPATLPTSQGSATDPNAFASGAATVDPQHDGRPTLAVGTIVDGNYRIEGLIGKGAMGVVYRAHHVRLDRPVALKLQRTIGDDTARLEREARAMARLDHPNVVGVYDVGMHDRDLYIAMEYVDGCSLRAWLAAGPHPWRQALEICLQVGRGIMAAHGAGIVHRDLKPDNVLVGRDGRVRVADFGIARGIVASGHTMMGESSLGPDLTRTGAMPGTPAYMAPEQFSGHADPRSDIFAFSVVLYEAMYGMRPFDGATLAELVHNVTSGRLRAVPASSPVPPEVLRAILGGLAINPRIRTATMAALLGELERAKIPKRSAAGVAVAVGIAAVGLLAVAGGTALWLAGRARAPNVITELVIGRDGPETLVITGADRDEPPSAPDDDDDSPAPVVAITPPTPTPPPEPPAATELDEAKRAGKRALVDMMRGKDVDPKALEGLLEVDDGDLVTATIAGVMMMDADAHADEGGFRRPGWDGQSKLLCKLGDKFRFEKEKLDIIGTAFQTMYGCQLQLIDCDITADTIAEVMMHTEVTIQGGTLRVRDQVIHQMGGTVIVAGAKIEGTPEVAFEAMGGTLHLADLTIIADTAVKASSKAEVTITGGRLEGKTAAIAASSHAKITIESAEIVGATKLASGATLDPAAPKK
jgi:predicted Ser/Thr protein kinase